MAEENSQHADEMGDPSDPGSFAYGQWWWQPGWQLPLPATLSAYRNPGWAPPLPGSLQAGPPLQHPPPKKLQRMVEAAVQ